MNQSPEIPKNPTFFDILKAMTKKYKNGMGYIFDIILNVAIIAAFVFIIRSFFISPFQVFGPSMCDTLNFIDDTCQRSYGEYIIVNKAVYQDFLGWKYSQPNRGDIIIFRPPNNPSEFFIKRVIGLPGETVQLKNGYVYILNKENPEGTKLDEPYLSKNNQGNTHPLQDGYMSFEVPEGSLFVLGDNRIQSSDSRSCFRENISSGKCGEKSNTPFLKFANIEGKAWLVLWPLSKITALSDPNY